MFNLSLVIYYFRYNFPLGISELAKLFLHKLIGWRTTSLLTDSFFYPIFYSLKTFSYILEIGIQTPEGVLLERLNEFLRNYRQTEQFGIENTEIEEDNEPVPYDPEKISIRRDTFTIFQINKMLEDKDINLNPDFQRNLV